MRREADRDAAAGIGIAGGVAAVAAVQGVVAGATLQGVVAGKAADRIVVVVAGEGVVEGRAGQVLDIGESVAAGTAGILGGALQRQADGDAAAGIGIAGGVGPVAAVQRVVAGAAVQRVVAAEALRILSLASPVRVSS